MHLDNCIPPGISSAPPIMPQQEESSSNEDNATNDAVLSCLPVSKLEERHTLKIKCEHIINIMITAKSLWCMPQNSLM